MLVLSGQAGGNTLGWTSRLLHSKSRLTPSELVAGTQFTGDSSSRKVGRTARKKDRVGDQVAITVQQENKSTMKQCYSPRDKLSITNKIQVTDII